MGVRGLLKMCTQGYGKRSACHITYLLSGRELRGDLLRRSCRARPRQHALAHDEADRARRVAAVEPRLGRQAAA